MVRMRADNICEGRGFGKKEGVFLMLVFFSRSHLVEIPKIPRLLKQEWKDQEPTELHTLIHIFTVWAMHCPKFTLSISDLRAC